MRVTDRYLGASACLILLAGCTGRSPRFDYCGAPPPGDTPVVFAPVSAAPGDGRLHGFPSFAPAGDEMCWPVIPPAIVIRRRVNGVWTEPAVLDLPGRNITAAIHSPDGSRLWFQGIIEGGLGSVDLWYVERTGPGWGPPRNPGPPVNGPGLQGQPSLTRTGHLYFTAPLEGVAWERGIYTARRTAHGWAEPVALPPSVNSPAIDTYPFIAPDETYLLFASSRPGREEDDLRLWVSFRTIEATGTANPAGPAGTAAGAAGAWSDPANVSTALDFDRPSRFPYVSPDGRYLFFQSGDEIWWVGSRILDALRSEIRR